MKVELKVNGKAVTADVPPNTLLVQFIREHLRLTGTHVGCDTAQCGACTVIANGRSIKACNTLVAQMQRADITTIEGVAEEAAAFARCMAAEGAEQCGFCTPGLTMTVLALRRELKAPDEEAINSYLAGNLCRCSGYAGQLRAIKTFLWVG